MEQRCLILDFNSATRVASCYCKENFDLILVKIENGVSPVPGQFLIFNFAQSIKQNEIITANSVRLEEPKVEDCIVKNPNEPIRISSWIAFSDDKRHKTYERKLAFSDWYGFVDATEIKWTPNFKKFEAFTSFIVVNDLNYKRNKTQLFKVKLIKKPKRSDYEELIEKMKLEEEKLLKPQPQRPARRIDDQRIESGDDNNINAFSLESLLANLTNPSPTSETHNQFHTGLGPRALPSSTPYTNASNEQFHSNDEALIIRQESEDRYVAWLTQRKEAALLSVSRVGLVRLGVLYKCIFEQKPEDSFEITNIEKPLEHLPFETEQSEFVNAKIRVNLCSPNTKCALWSFHMGTAFLNSPDVGIVTIADFVDTPFGRNKSWQEALREYLGEPQHENMLCVCRLVKQKVPKKLTNAFLMDDFLSVSRYTWQVIKICETEKVHEFKEKRLKNENLGGKVYEYEEDDEIARAKRETKNRVRFGPDRTHLNYDQQPCSSGSPYIRFE